MGKEALAYTKAGSSLRKPPVPEHLPPKPEFVYFTYALTYSSGFMGVSPPSTFLSEKELTYSSKSIKIPGRDKSVSTYELP